MNNLGNEKEFGIEGYQLRRTIELDKPRNVIMWPGPKKTFVDAEIKAKKHVPCSHYAVMGDISKNNKKSALCKSPRHLISTEIEHKAKRTSSPSPDSYAPNEKHVTRRVIGAFNLKGEREHTSFLSDSQYRG